MGTPKKREVPMGCLPKDYAPVVRLLLEAAAKGEVPIMIVFGNVVGGYIETRIHPAYESEEGRAKLLSAVTCTLSGGCTPDNPCSAHAPKNEETT